MTPAGKTNRLYHHLPKAKHTVMKKSLLLISFLLSVAVLQAQFNNSWIDYSKTYYKCKVAQTGLYRIGTTTLAGLGLSNTPAEQFQLWHNGRQVPLYTSAASGVLPAGGYIEFWGEMNDGALDEQLYKDPSDHLNATYSLSTDTSAYFLAVNEGENARFLNEVNDIRNNTLPAEPYFIYTYKSDYKQQINRGKGLYYGETIYSSTYDMGEFWSSFDIAGNASRTVTMSSLNVATGGPAAYAECIGRRQFDSRQQPPRNGERQQQYLHQRTAHQLQCQPVYRVGHSLVHSQFQYCQHQDYQCKQQRERPDGGGHRSPDVPTYIQFQQCQNLCVSTPGFCQWQLP